MTRIKRTFFIFVTFVPFVDRTIPIIECMKNHRIFGYLATGILLAGILGGCQKVDFSDIVRDDDNSNGVDATGITYQQHGQDSLVAKNDTALFYLSGQEISGITLQDHPTPSALVRDSRYRLPTKLEISGILKNAIPDGYWQSGQRILCYDRPEDDGIKIGSTSFGSGLYYTFKPSGAITRAGQKTEYCILPIRTEPRQTIHIDIDTEWNEW